ncbi:hypothetical protein [Dysosmobacter sp.]|uniref:hypothetical protein n=1 Tax=Dysosmobacter sp. TaxID=2591382 RepID=UPI002A8465BB|nr:hypothetical protein [Dysosmobacter sp.]MDY3984023.1 hypothetical protein [Dysosmobacter sp.]
MKKKTLQKPEKEARLSPGFSGCRKSPMDFFDAFTIPRFSGCSAARKSAAARRKRLLAQAFCRHLIPHEGAPAPSYSPCKMQLSCFKQWFFDKLKWRGDSPPFFWTNLRFPHIIKTQIT